MPESMFCYATGQCCNAPCELGKKVQTLIDGNDYLSWVLRITEEGGGRESERHAKAKEAVGVEATTQVLQKDLTCRRQLPLVVSKTPVFLRNRP